MIETARLILRRPAAAERPACSLTTRSQALAALPGVVRDPAAANPCGDATQVWRHGRGGIA